MTKNITQNTKRFMTHQNIYFDKIKKFLKADDVLLLCLPKKVVFHFEHGPCWPLFSANLAPKYQFLEGFPNFFQNYWITMQVNNINWTPNIFHWKSTRKGKWVWSRGKIWTKLGWMLWNWHFQQAFFIFCMINTFKSKK